jgi:hypothetical protein
VEDPAARREVLWRVRLLAESCFLCGCVFDGGLWDALFRFVLWLCALKLDVKLVAKLMAGSAPPMWTPGWAPRHLHGDTGEEPVRCHRLGMLGSSRC